MCDRPQSSGWAGPLRRPARPWDSVILPAMVKENLLLDVKEFMSNAEKTWYASKGEYVDVTNLTCRNTTPPRVCEMSQMVDDSAYPLATYFMARQGPARLRWVNSGFLRWSMADEPATAVASKLRLNLYCVSPASAGSVPSR